MKIYKYIIFPLVGLLATACSAEDEDSDELIILDPVHVESVGLSLGEIEDNSSEASTRALSDFAVRGVYDPTSTLENRTLWNLDLKIYKGNTIFDLGEGTFTWDIGQQAWVTPTDVYFPNYLRQKVSALLYPNLPDDPIDGNQTNSDDLLAQDILEQNGNNTITVLPAHIPNIPMRHSRTMLDFIISDVVESQIASVEVEADGGTYYPYRVALSDRMEYMVIIPTGVDNPQVKITTGEGARYTQQIPIKSTQPNYCYCIKFKGVELVLSTITVSDWVYGEAVAGDYTTITSYPTFYGPAGVSCTLIYDNTLEQEITFNQRGEATAKPDGRTIVTIKKQDGSAYTLDPPLSIRGMYIDLTEYF